jgi:putative membrane protein
MNYGGTRYAQVCAILTLFTAMVVSGQSSTAGTGQNDTTQSSSDKTFVKNALEGGNAEIQLGQLAQQKSTSEDVKQFGQKMVTDHTQMADQLKPIAQQLNIPATPSLPMKDKMIYTKLKNLSGPDFDREYIKAMVKDHQKDLKEFRQEASSGQDPQVKQAAQQGASVISQHLNMIEQIAQQHQIDTGDGQNTSNKAQ